jgi:hypothetical protein
MSSEENQERERVFRVLYGLDKQRIFLTGDPCDIYAFDSDLELFRSNKSELDTVGLQSQKLTLAFDSLMMIWEETYLTLYSARAVAVAAEILSNQVTVLAQSLRKWRERHIGAIDTAGPNSSSLEEDNNSCGRHDVVNPDVDD